MFPRVSWSPTVSAFVDTHGFDVDSFSILTFRVKVVLKVVMLLAAPS